MNRTSVLIREGNVTDLPQVLTLIRELAVFERAEGEVVATVEQMERDGFGLVPAFGFFVAEDGAEIIGLALYYYRYSSWKGRRLYLEDIIVTESRRGHGIGKMLFERTMRKSHDEGCTGMMWQVLEWNTPAINFYRKYAAKMDNEWTNCTLESDQIKAWIGNAD